MVMMWSMASHVAFTGPADSVFAEAGLPRQDVDEEALQDLLPMEPLWDVLLPFLGFPVGGFGFQLTLSLSLAEPLLLLLLPRMRGALREYHDRLLSWHLGALFGQPMLVAQVALSQVVLEGEAHLAAAFGRLVGAYAAGAVLGVLANHGLFYGSGPFLGSTLAEVSRVGLVLTLVMMNLLVLVCTNTFTEEKEREEDTAPHESTPFVERAPSSSVSLSASHLATPLREIWWTVEVAIRCFQPLLARSFLLFALAMLLHPTPSPTLDVFELCGLPRGFSVHLFDVVGILTSCLVVPALLEWPCRVAPSSCVRLTHYLAIFSCGLASLAGARHEAIAFRLVILAGMIVSVCAAFVGAILFARMVQKAPKKAGVALGWGLLGGGYSQWIGGWLGQVLYLKYSWAGVCVPATLAVALSWLLASTDETERISERQQ